MMTLNIGIPEIVLAVVIGVSLWAARRIRISNKYMLIALAGLVAVLAWNWATTFRPVN
jgi:hypothetical protein